MSRPSFLDAIGLRIEKLIDSIPILGVPTPIQPWDPLQDTKAAVLSDPFDVLKTLLKWDGFTIRRLFEENLLYLSHMRSGRGNANDLNTEGGALIQEPILVTSDDASVERSVASFADLNTEEESFGECPSVVTECDVGKNEVKEVKSIEVNVTAHTQESDDEMMTDDENDYVLAEQTSDDEDEDFALI